MKLIIIFGPQAVGKMTVGQELQEITKLKLFHNHMTIDLVSLFFDYGSDAGKRLVNLFRQEIFKEVAKSNQEGLIFTFVWAFNEKSDWDYIDNLCSIFESKGSKIYFVELEANIDERIKRNKHPHRLCFKPIKKDIAKSEQNLKDYMDKYRLNSEKGEIKKENYLRIDNTNLSPKKTARKIKERFQL